MQNVRTETFQQTPIPIETAYFLNDAAKFKTDKGYQLMRDKNKFNRYYFNYPPEWKTSNMGEMIVGVRSLWTLNKRRYMKFLLLLRKYPKKDFFDKAQMLYPKEYGEMNLEEFNKLELTDERIQEIIDKMDQTLILHLCTEVVIWLSVESDLRDTFYGVNKCVTERMNLHKRIQSRIDTLKDVTNDTKFKMTQTLNRFSNKELVHLYNLGFWFEQYNSSMEPSNFDIEVQMDGYYENGSFNEVFYSPRNTNFPELPWGEYHVDIMLANVQSTFDKRYTCNASMMRPNEALLGKDETLPGLLVAWGCQTTSNPQPLDDKDKFSNDFNTVFNIGDESWQNSLDYITRFHRKLVLKNVYDRNSVKVYASFGNPSNNYYIGNSHVYFNPIKYYKLNAKDDKFWIEFYSGRHPDCPVNIPEDEGFVLEMLFMQNQKLLYT